MSSVSEDQDQRNNAGLEDLATMTIESLRARLLSERAISRTARQRADELAKRVVELEGQLKIVSVQRKKAEKATADVLAILESNGISDALEAYDSSYDQETSVCDSKDSNDTVRRKESSNKFDLRRNDMEAYSSSEIDSSSTGRSLSWKSSKDSPKCLDRNKYKDSTRRRCSGFASNKSAPKRVGKSCRRTRRRETRSAPEEILNDDNVDDVHDTTVTTHSQDLPNSDFGSQTKRKDPEDHEIKDPTGAPLSGISGNGISDANLYGRKGQVEDLERDLQDEAHHVAKYEAEEKAQREWEEKFGEDNSCLMDSCDPGNRSDVTEERDDIRATEQAYRAGMKNCLNQEREQEIGKSFIVEKPEVLSKFLAPSHADNGQTEDQKTGFGQESSSSEFAFPMLKGTHDQVSSENNDNRPSHGSFMCLLSNGSLGNPPTCSTFSSANNGESSRSRKELSLMPQTSSGNLESVLDALQEAKLSLKHKLHPMPQLEVGSSGKGIESSIPAGKIGDRKEFPLGCPPGIFRLPTDFQFERSANANYLCSDSALRLQNYYLESTYDKLISRPFMESRPSSSVRDPFCTSSSITSEMNSGINTYTPHFTHRGLGMHASAAPYTEVRPVIPYSEIRPGIPSTKTAFESASDAELSSSGRSTFLDSQMNTGFPFSNKYTYPKYPFSPDVAPKLSSGERFPKNMQGLEFGMPSAARFSFSDDHIRRV